MDKPITVIKIAVAVVTVSGLLGLIALIVMLVLGSASGQTHTMPGSNVVPSGATLTIQSGGTINAAAGSTVTGFGAGGGAPTTATYITQTGDAGLSAEVPLSGLATGLLKSTITTGALTTITDNSTNWNTAFTQMLQWDGGSTNLVAATGRTSLGGTTVGQSFFTLANPGVVSFPEISAGNAVSAVSAATMRTDLGVQPLDSDLTLWAGITPVAAVGTWIATPSSANLRLAMTDENGTGALLFSGATTPDFTTGFTIGGAAASGKIPIGNGTNYVPSTPTFSNAPSTALKWMRSDGTNWITSTSLLSDTPSTALKWLRSDGTNWITSTSTLAEGAVTAGKMLQSDATNWVASTPTWPTTAGTAGYTIRSDGTNFAAYPQDMFNSSVTSQATFSTSDIYITNSNVTVAAGDMKAKGQYRCLFDMTKSAGTGAIVISVRVGTLGAIGDAQILTFTFGAGTAVADTGTFEIIATWRTVGSGTSAVMQGVCRAQKNAATTTGLWNNTGTDLVIVATTSSGFASNTATNIGVSFNGSTAFAGTSTLCQATLIQ